MNETSLTELLHSAIHFLGFNKKKFKHFGIFFSILILECGILLFI